MSPANIQYFTVVITIMFSLVKNQTVTLVVKKLSVFIESNC
jgi:hypothetical protein